ncbi:hypothetical protein HN51_031453, partial [Arachis hypogaea]
LSHVNKIMYKLSSFSNSPLDITAAERSLDFMFIEPLTIGDYPESMKSIAGSRLHKFSKEQSKQLIHSYDFIRLNYYTTNYASNAPKLLSAKQNYATDSNVNFATKCNGVPIGPRGLREKVTTALSAPPATTPQPISENMIFGGVKYEEKGAMMGYRRVKTPAFCDGEIKDHVFWLKLFQV